jgi:hypothetical protein
MEPKKFRNKHGPEYVIQRDFIRYLKDRGWHVERMIGNQLQFGIPDIYAMHPEHGQRWIDLKNPVSYEYTVAQRWKWPIWEEHGCGLWIITAATEEEYDKLFHPPNWRAYWKDKYEEDNIDEMMQELFDEYDSQ